MNESLEEEFMATKLKIGIPLLTEEEAKENLYAHAVMVYKLIQCCDLLRAENKRLVDFINGVRLQSPFQVDEND